MLAECYKTLQKQDAEHHRDQKFEVIFLSSDREQTAFDKYYAEMPWLALEFSDQSLKEQLEARYNVDGIPTLVVIDPKTGKSINEDTVQAVMSDPAGTNFPWAPKPVELLDDVTASSVGPSPAVFVFCGTDAKAKELQSDLSTAVDVWRGKTEAGAVCHGDVCIPTGGKLAGSEDISFFVCGEHPVVERLQEIAKAKGVVVAILDLSVPVYSHATDIVSVEKVTPMALRKFVQGYLNGTVQKLPVQKM